MNKEFKYMPLETDATGGRGGDMPAISKHMSKSPLGLYKSPAQMGNKSPLELSKKKEKSAEYIAKQKEVKEKNKKKKEKITYQSKVNSIARAEKVGNNNRAQRLR